MYEVKNMNIYKIYFIYENIITPHHDMVYEDNACFL